MIESTKFRNKITGEVRTQIPLFEMNEWEEVGAVKKESKKLPSKVQLYGQMWMKNNGDIVYVNSGVETRPFKLNLQKQAPKMYKKIVESYDTKEGKEVRERAFYAIARTLEGGM
jgi:hypothetical protein